MAFFITQLCIIMLHNCVLLFCNIHRVKNKHIVAEPDRECLLKFDQSNVDLLMKKIYQKELES